MVHTRVSINRNWYGKIPLDRDGKPIPRNLWAKRRKLSWEVRWYDTEGKRPSKSFRDRKEANEYVQKIQDKVDKGKADRPKKISLEEFIKEHSRVMVGQIAHSTLKDHIRALNLFGDHVGKQILLEKITPRDAESFVAKRLSDRLATATVNKDIRTLRGIFNLAIEPRSYLAEGTNPFRKIRERKLALNPPKYLSPEEFAKLYEAANNLWWKTFLSMAYTTAGRRDELLNLTWQDVDFENCTISFLPKKTSKKILAWEPKTHESRMLPVPERTVQLLADLQAQCDNGNPYVFIKTNRLNTVLYRRQAGTWQPDYEVVNNLLRSLKGICKRAKVDFFTPHDFRRSCITNWAKKLPIQTVQYLAGHSNIITTRKYYLSVQDSDLEQAREIEFEVMTKLTNF